MADRDRERDRDRDRERERERERDRPTDIMKSILPEKGPSKSQVMAVITLFPLGGFLLLLSGLILAGTVLGLAVCTPLFILFSPVLVPAALTIGLAVTGFLTSGAFGMTALSSLSWMVNYLRSLRVPEKIDQAKRQLQETAGQLGQKARETAPTVQSKAQEGGRAIEGAGRRAQEGGKEKESVKP